VSQPIFPNEPGNGVDDNNPRSWRVALGRAVTARVLPKICERAARLGWDAMALFGCAPKRPLDYFGKHEPTRPDRIEVEIERTLQHP
jgi:hypothetical protein